MEKSFVSKKNLLKKAKCIFSSFLYRLLLILLPSPKANCDDSKITIVCAASLGDFVVSCFACRELFRQGKELTLICRKKTGIEEFAELTGFFKKVVSLPHEYFKRVGNLKCLRGIKAHTVLVMPPERHILSDLYALSISADERILPDTMQGCSLPKLKNTIDRYADKLIPVSAVKEQKRYEEYLQGAGLYQGRILPFIFDGKKNLLEYRKHPYIMVFPGANGGRFKQWPVERFAYVARQLCQERGCNVLVCGTAEEWLLGKKLCDLLEGGENFCGKTSIAELGKLFRGAALVLANDSGSAHMAIAFGAPTVIICGGWEYGRFYPNPDLPENCKAMVEKAGVLTCMPCGRIRASCAKGIVARCILKLDVEQIVQTTFTLYKLSPKDKKDVLP